MPDPTQVSILKRNGTKTYYSTYAAARMVAVDGDLIQIWSDLTERIGLVNGVDVWIADGAIIKSNNSSPTIYEFSGAVTCNIYGGGIIKNEISSKCILISDFNTKLSIECESIIGIHSAHSSSIIIEIQKSKKFHLKCKLVSCDVGGIIIGSTATDGTIVDLNLEIGKIETGILNNNVASTSLLTHANGYIKIDEILCKTIGHCFRHSGGIITAKVKKMTSMNNVSGTALSTVHLAQGDGTQKLILYFDEIANVRVGSLSSSITITQQQGTGIFIGRKVFSTDSNCLSISGTDSKGYVKCNEMISEFGTAMVLNGFTNQITIDSNNLVGYGAGGVIYSADAANFVIKNAKIRNTFTGTSVSSIGIFIFGGSQSITLNNVQIITGELSNGRTIFLTPPENEIAIKNYGLFVNKGIESNVDLLIGKGLSDPNYNYLYIVDPLLT